jgi:hypothetical protein
MGLREYFENTPGKGVLATASGDSRVDAAIYSRPHILEDGTAAIIMHDRLTHANLEENPHAAYLFIEEGGGYRGVRLFLTRVREEEEGEIEKKLLEETRALFDELLRGRTFAVVFSIDRELPLIGPG